MKRVVTMAVALALAGPTGAWAQTKDAAGVLTEARKAMGGEKLAALKSLSAEGRTLRTGPDGNTRESEFELHLEQPDKYRLRTVLAAMGNMSVYRMTGFNGDKPIEEVDQPPNLAGGNIMIRIAGPGGNTADVAKMTPEQKVAFDKMRLEQNRREFTRLALGMFAAAPAFHPLAFTYAGEAESPDGKADVIDVKDAGDFAVRLFIDQQTRLPLMISWMAREPIRLTVGGPGGPAAAGGGAATSTFVASGGGGGGATTVMAGRWEGAGGQAPSREDMEKRMKEIEAARKEAEAKARTVEYRVYYGDYQAVNGVMLPHRIQRSIDGKTTEEMVFDKVKVNPKIDAKTFEPSK